MLSVLDQSTILSFGEGLITLPKVRNQRLDQIKAFADYIPGIQPIVLDDNYASLKW